MGFVVTLGIPALEIGAIKRVMRHFAGHLPQRVRPMAENIGIFTDNLRNELRNALAFVHEQPNLTAAQMMGNPSISPEHEWAFRRARVKQ